MQASCLKAAWRARGATLASLAALAPQGQSQLPLVETVTVTGSAPGWR